MSGESIENSTTKQTPKINLRFDSESYIEPIMIYDVQFNDPVEIPKHAEIVYAWLGIA